jgi:hypothetical protein
MKCNGGRAKMADGTLTESTEPSAATSDRTDPIPQPHQTPLFHAFEQARYSRQEQLKDIQKRTGRFVIAYIAGPATSISGSDVPPFVDLLHDIPPNSNIDLMLHTSGGDIDQAERIVLLCRKRVGTGEFRVVVPDSAKSAGTLIALAADKIVMGEPSELGPIDPQIDIMTSNGERWSRPAHSFLKGIESIAKEVEDNDGKLSPVYFPLLDKLDTALIDFCNVAIERSKQFARDFLQKYMLKNDHDKAEEIAETLNSRTRYLSHGAVIDAEDALELGLDVLYLPPEDDVWQAFWRLYCAMRLALQQPHQVLYEAERASMLF